MADLICSTDALPDYVAQDCGGDNGGVIAVFFHEPEVSFNGSPNQIEDPAAWTALTSASPQLLQIIKNTRGEMPKGSPVEGDGYGRVSTQVTGRSHSMTFSVLGVKENQLFFKRANRRRNLRFGFITNGNLLHYVGDRGVSIDAGPVVESDINSFERYDVTVTWDAFDFPEIYDAPEGIFD